MMAPRDGQSDETHWTSHPVVKSVGWSIAALAGIAGIVGILFQVIAMNQSDPDQGATSAGPGTSPPTTVQTPDSDVVTGGTVLESAAGIHTGFPAARIEDVFGAAIAERPLEGDLPWVQRTYASDDVAASAVIDDNDTIVLYSVMVCAPGANARFTTPINTTVVLQGPPIFAAESSESSGTDLNDRYLSYLEGGTGSSLGHLIEESVTGPASGNGWRSYLIGVNRACGDTNFGAQGDVAGLEYVGSVDDAPDALRSFREVRPADFYTEIGVDHHITEDTTIDFSTPGGDVFGALAAPYIHDLPPDFGT